MYKRKKGHSPLIIIITVICLLIGAASVYFTFFRKKKDNFPEYEENSCGFFVKSLSNVFSFETDSLEFDENILPDDVLTNEKLCVILDVILNYSDTLRSAFVPEMSISYSGEDTSFYSSLFAGLSVYDENSYDGQILLRQKNSCSNLKERCLIYGDGHYTVICDFDGYEGDYEYLIDDYSEISPFAAESVDKMLSLGLCPFFLSDDYYGFFLNPTAETTKETLSAITDCLKHNTNPNFIDGINLKTNNGILQPGINPDFYEEIITEIMGKEYKFMSDDTVTLKISSVPFLYAAKKAERIMDKDDEMFFSYDSGGTGFAIYFNTESTGTFCLPLKYCEGSPVSFVFSPLDLANPNEKCEKTAVILPEKRREEFSEKAAEASVSEEPFRIAGISFQFFNRGEYSVLYIGTNYEKEN